MKITRQHLFCPLFFLLSLLVINIANAEITKVPIWQDNDGRVRVSVILEDGRDYDFVVDTGMMTTMITPDLVAELQPDGMKEIQPGGSSHGGGMPTSAYRSLKVTIGGKVGYVITSPPVLSAIRISEETVYGILGSEFLQRYAVGFDLVAGEMILSDEGPEVIFPGRDFAKVSMTSPFANLWFTDMTIGGVSVTAFLDIGASRTLLNPVAAERIGADNISETPGKETRVMGSDGAVSETTNATVREINTGPKSWANKDVVVTSGIFSRLRLTGEPALIAGTDLLLSGRLILDYANGEVYFELP